MDVLVTFPDTQSVLQAEQILARRKIPFETVPQSHYRRKKCGLGIIFSHEYLDAARTALEETHLKADFNTLENKPTP